MRKNFPLHGLILVCTFIAFEKKKSPLMFIPSCKCIGICPAALLILRKISPCTALIWSARLMFFKNFPTWTFISSYRSIREKVVKTQIDYFPNCPCCPNGSNRKECVHSKMLLINQLYIKLEVQSAWLSVMPIVRIATSFETWGAVIEPI